MNTNWVDSEGGFVRYGSVFTKEDNFINNFACSFLPPFLQMILSDYTVAMLKQSHSLIRETLHILFFFFFNFYCKNKKNPEMEIDTGVMKKK